MNSPLKIAYYLPEKVLTNEALEADFPDWKAADIEAKTGIRKRHCAAPDEISSDCAVKAAELLFKEYEIDKQSVDFLLFVTQSQDHASPTTACLIQHRLGLKTSIGAFDINLGCTGFVYALSVAKAMLFVYANIQNVLILTSETLTKYIHPKDKSARTIFGDAGTASLIEKKQKIGQFEFGTDGGGEIMIKRFGAFRYPFTHFRGEDYDDGFGSITNDDYFRMKGQDVFVFAVRKVPKLVAKTLEVNNRSLDDVDLVIFHQANGFLLEHLRKKINIPKEKFFTYIREVGNTVSSSIPIALKEAQSQNRLHQGDTVLLVAFGVGLSWSATVIDI